MSGEPSKKDVLVIVSYATKDADFFRILRKGRNNASILRRIGRILGK